MNINAMRNIDFYVGVPLCFLITCVETVLRVFRSDRLPKPERVLFIELSEMGSAVLADPSMRRAQTLGCEIYFLIFKRNKASLRLLKTVKDDNIFVLRDQSMFFLLWDSLRFVYWCRKKRIDSCIDLELFSRVTALLTWATFAGNRVGFHRFHQEGLYRGEFFTHRVPYNAHVHIAHNFMNLVESLVGGGLGLEEFLKRKLAPEDLKVAKATISNKMRENVQLKIQEKCPGWHAGKPLLLINANAGDFLPQRKWPKESFVSLIRLFLDSKEDLFVLLTGSPQEKEANHWIVSTVRHPRCIDFSGGVEFDELPTLYSLSRVLITNDSGPGHFSSVTDIRSYIFFGPETPNLYGSLGNSSAFYSQMSCSPCVSATNHRKTKCTDNQCLKVISPSQVFSEVSKSL